MTGSMPRRALRTGLIVGTSVATVAGLAAATTAVLSVLVARGFTRWPTGRRDELEVAGVDLDAATIALRRASDSSIPGRYGLWFDHSRGYARIGAVLDETSDSVTRELLSVDYGTPRAPMGARLSGWFYRHPRELGLPVRDVVIATAAGAAPAWHLPVSVDAEGVAATNPTWAIVVHGHGSARPEGLRAVAPLHAMGWDALLISYRNDGTAPASPDRRTALGDREWLDVEEAMRYAVAQGAERIVLVGFSLGGAIVLQAATRAVNGDRVAGVVLDSPVVDWVVALDHLAARMRVPGVVRRGAYLMAGEPWGGALTGLNDPIDWKRLNFVARAGELAVPILLMHSDDDGYVVPDASLALAAARPDIVRFERWTTARHAKLWNLDPERWEGDIRDWLGSLG